ncbi:uncharacterized protein V1510DRAFT_359204 [Dipodascopsis tothii]|uniref:uncharacterized protein n=1 Tax=Dipodascopsis tothii TaxID=44089 RepID=UPI0034CE01E5
MHESVGAFRYDGKHECPVCGKRFKKLEDHLWTHSSEPKPHKCRVGYITTGKHAHGDGQATVICSYVTVGFARAADRNRHELKHFQGRFTCPFGAQCRLNGERFGRLDTFKRHLRTVHGSHPVVVAAVGGTENVFAKADDDGRRKRGRKADGCDSPDALDDSPAELDCGNCHQRFQGVDHFIAHLNDCTYAIMHPDETGGATGALVLK